MSAGHPDAPAAGGQPPAGDAPVSPDPWARWRRFTPARIALGRAGAAQPTTATLAFGWSHALARDAIHAPLDADALARELASAGWPVERVRSQVPDRDTYLRRPDLGRKLDEADARRHASRAAAEPALRGVDLCLVIGDGLSSFAVQRHAVPLLQALRPLLPADWRLAPVTVATQARVALGDDVGAAFGARYAVMLIGERPGLSSPDSLGVYLTRAPQRGRTDAERNCISNVRPEGLTYAQATHKLAWLLREADRLGATGVALKDGSDRAVLDAEPAAAAIAAMRTAE